MSTSRLNDPRDRTKDRHSRLTSGRHSRLPSSNVGQRQTTIELGGGGPSINKRRQHIREVSRQSRMSYLSTVGTLTSIGTRFTEGSFGAQGGFRAKLIRSFKLNKNKKSSQNLRSSELRRNHHHPHFHHNRRRPSNSGGVLPGAVGTSAGGTKWVGQTFEVGKRFWQAIENREEMLLTEEAALDDVPEEELENEGIEVKRRQASDGTSIIRSPDDVLKSFAREASDALAVPNGNQVQAPALTFSGSESDPSDGVPNTPDRTIGQSEQDKLSPPSNLVKDPKNAHTLERVNSATSLLTVPQDRVMQSTWDIENRSGWSDVMTFISAQSSLPASIQRSARSAGDNLNEFGTKAKRAFDGQLADFRAKQVAARHAREKNRSEELSRSMIREISQTSEDVKASSADAMLNKNPDDLSSKQRRKAVSRKLLSKTPEPPMAAEEKFPEVTLELARRPSFSGEIRNDAASDHEVAARPTYENHDEQREEESHSGIEPKLDFSTLRPKNVRLESEKHSPMELPSLPVEGQSPSENLASILHSSGEGTEQSRHLKAVKFTGALANLPQRSMTTNELIPSSSNDNSLTSNLAGRIRPIIRMGDSAPAPPEEVLMRDSTPDEQMSKKFGKSANEADLITSKSVLRRDRMLTKLMWTASEDVPKEFTERESRKYELHSDPFREYMVVLRMGRLELWDDPRWMKRMMEKTENLNLRLRYVAPLRKGHAFVSLYSPVDTIFCVNFTPTHHRGLLNLRKSGTHLWLFDGRSSTNGADWMWDLWRELGGEIPDAIDVHVPVLSFRIRIPIPEEMPQLQGEKKGKRSKSITSKVGIKSLSNNYDEKDEDDQGSQEVMKGEGYKWINRKNVIQIVSQLAHQIPQWSELCARLEQRGIHFGLAWRTHSTLSWIQHVTTIDEQRRDWAVLVGSILCDHKSPSSLEFRAAMHYPQTVRSVKGETLEEPPAVEGFLWRVKAVSGALTRLYITTQDGLIFVNRPSRAFLPERYIAIEPTQTNQVKKSNSSFGELSVDAGNRRTKSVKRGNRKAVQKTDDTLATLGKQAIERITTEAFSVEELDGQIEAFRAFEKRRLFEQIANSDGYVDVRDIFSIHCVDGKGGVRRPSADGRGSSTKTTPMATPAKESENVTVEPEDVGGEEGYGLAKDRAALKESRQFEVTMINGRTIRFEAYSQSVCQEWVDGLYNLAVYWKRREKVDALEHMTACGNDPAMVHRKLRHTSNARPLENEAGSEKISPILTDIWNWCILDGCRTVLRSGRLFTKKMPYSAFASRYCILVSGRILTFKLMTSNRTARARQNAGIFHKRQDTVIHLRDSYVYSGRLTDHMLVNGRSDGAGALSNFGGGTGGASSSSTRHTLPRIYADGLLSTDEDEECTFVIRYRPQRVNRSVNPHLNPVDQESELQQEDDESNAQKATTGNISITTLRDSTVNVIAMRARSRLERDIWVWAINAERERIVREDSLRENQIRQHGQTPYKTSHHFHSLH